MTSGTMKPTLEKRCGGEPYVQYNSLRTKEERNTVDVSSRRGGRLQ